MYPLIIAFIGVACLVWAGWRGRIYHTQLRDCLQTPGRVTEWRHGKLQRATPLGTESIEGQFPCVSYTPQGGETTTLLVEMSAQVGDEVVVWYNPSDPSKDQVSRYGMLPPIYACAGLGILLLLLSLFLVHHG